MTQDVFIEVRSLWDRSQSCEKTEEESSHRCAYKLYHDLLLVPLSNIAQNQTKPLQLRAQR